MPGPSFQFSSVPVKICIRKFHPCSGGNARNAELLHVKKSYVRIYSYCRLKLGCFGQVQNSLFVLKQILLLLSFLTEQKGKLLEIFGESSGSGFVKRVQDLIPIRKLLCALS